MGKYGSPEPTTTEFFGDNGGDENNSNLINEQETKTVNNINIKTLNNMAITINPTPTVTAKIAKMEFYPFTAEGIAGTDKFEMTEIVAGAGYEEADPSFTNTDSETKDSPIHISAVAGDKTWTINVGDLQPELMKQYYGATIEAETGEVLMPTQVKSIYAKLVVHFTEGYGFQTIYKALVTASTTMADMKTGIMQGKLSFKVMEDADNKTVGYTPRKAPTV